MVTSNDKWFNEIDGEQAFPFLGKTREGGMRTAFHEFGTRIRDVGEVRARAAGSRSPRPGA